MAKITDFKKGDIIIRPLMERPIHLRFSNFFGLTTSDVLADDWELVKTKKVGYFVLYKENKYANNEVKFLDQGYDSEEEAIEDLKNFGTYIKIVKVEWEE